MNLQEQFEQNLSAEKLFSVKDRLLIAVSGGLDSVVLCELCYRAGIDFVMAHCNFQLRGEESDRDEAFVLELGKKYEKQVLVKHFPTNAYAAQNKVSTQVAARELRYSWFYDLLEKTPDSRLPTPDYLVTAHHADDNLETLLMNFFKGTGIAGLHGILPKQGKIVRPLLFARKTALAEYAREKGLSWVEDSSNATDNYTRNYFRHQLIPLIQKVYPQVENNLLNNIPRFREAELLYQQSIDRHKKKLLEPKGNEIHIPVLKLKLAAPLPTITYEIIKEYGFSSGQVPEVIKLLDSGSGQMVASATHRIIRNRNWLIIAPVVTEEADTILIEATTDKVTLKEGALSFSRKSRDSVSVTNESTTALLDARQIQFPLLVRRWKAGDYFYPLGMRKKKKVARFLIDQKVSKTDKEKVWVVEMNQKILWVVGHRIDDRFRIKESTTEVLEINVSSL